MFKPEGDPIASRILDEDNIEQEKTFLLFLLSPGINRFHTLTSNPLPPVLFHSVVKIRQTREKSCVTIIGKNEYVTNL